MNTFFGKLLVPWSQGKFVCVGLDVDTAKFPEGYKVCVADIYRFNCAVIDATKHIVAAYKPNLWFYLQYGAEGMRMLEHTIRYIRSVAPHAIIILDAKFNDIGSTTNAQVHLAYSVLQVDAVTANAYLGQDAAQSFLDRPEGIFWLAKTSNPGSGEFQDQRLDMVDQPYLFEHVADVVANEWQNKHQNCGLVFGATHAGQISAVRKVAPNTPLLMPGFGAQGADLRPAVLAARTAEGGFLANNGSGLIYASSDVDFAKTITRMAMIFHGRVRAAVNAVE